MTLHAVQSTTSDVTAGLAGRVQSLNRTTQPNAGTLRIAARLSHRSSYSQWMHDGDSKHSFCYIALSGSSLDKS